MCLDPINSSGGSGDSVIEQLEQRRLLSSYGLDKTFSSDGFANVSFGTPQSIAALLVTTTSSNKILVVANAVYPGAASTLVMAQFNADGSPDRSFGTDGNVAVFDNGYTSDATLETDGKIVVTGYRNSQPYVARINANGTLDTTFSGDGFFDFTLTDGRATVFQPDNVRIGPDGSINVLGNWSDHFTWDVGVVRLTSGGAFDTSFDGDGLAIIPGIYRRFDLAVQADGKPVVVGAEDHNAFSARLTNDGQPDSTWGTTNTGVIHYPIEMGWEFFLPTVQSDGKIIVNVSDNVARLTTSGALDTSFSGDGIAPLSSGMSLEPVTCFAMIDNKLMAINPLGVSRYLPDGTFDPSFTEDGLFVGITPEQIQKTSIMVDSAGRVVMSGYTTSGSIATLTTARFVPLPDVRLDADGRLFVAAGARDDVVAVDRVGSSIRLTNNGAVTNYPAGDVKSIELHLADGNNRATITALIEASVFAGSGNDTITVSGSGKLTIDSGAGNDNINAGARDATVTGGAGDDTIISNAKHDMVGVYDVSINGGDGNDSITTGDSVDNILDQSGDNFISSGAGNDTVYGGTGNDTIDAGAGNDTIATDSTSTGGSHDIAHGGPGDDRIYATANSTVYGDDGNDLLLGQVAPIATGPSGIVMYGGAGNDIIGGSTGGDLIFGGDGNDSVRGSSGDDTIWGDMGYDTLRGLDGNDLINGGAGKDRIFGGDGRDRIYGRRADDGIDGGPDADRLEGDEGIDKIAGGEGNDTIIANDGTPETIYGGDGNDLAIVDLVDSMVDVERTA